MATAMSRRSISRHGNSNVEEEYLSAYLARRGYTDKEIRSAIAKLKQAAGSLGGGLYNANSPNYIQGKDNPDLTDRWKPAHWEGAVSESGKSVYEALLQVHTLDTVGVLADITVALADMKVSILQINSQKAGSDRVIINLKVSCKNVEHYNSIVSRLRSLQNILDVIRGFA